MGRTNLAFYQSINLVQTCSFQIESLRSWPFEFVDQMSKQRLSFFCETDGLHEPPDWLPIEMAFQVRT